MYLKVINTFVNGEYKMATKLKEYTFEFQGECLENLQATFVCTSKKEAFAVAYEYMQLDLATSVFEYDTLLLLNHA